MNPLTTLLVSAAGLTFSLSLGLVIEELLFGAIFRLMFGAPKSSDVNDK
jgi:hypothetical protein